MEYLHDPEYEQCLNANNDVERNNISFQYRTHESKGTEDGDYFLFDIKDLQGNIFQNVQKIHKRLLNNLDSKYYNKEEKKLNFDIFYDVQKGCKVYQPMYFEQPYKTGDNKKPLKSLLFPKSTHPPHAKWCFKNKDRFDFSPENVYTMTYNEYRSLSDDKKPCILNEEKLLDTKLAKKYDIDEDYNISYK